MFVFYVLFENVVFWSCEKTDTTTLFAQAAFRLIDLSHATSRWYVNTYYYYIYLLLQQVIPQQFNLIQYS